MSSPHGTQNPRFWPDIPDCNSIFNCLMATKWRTKLEVAQKMCRIVFQGHPSNFKVTRKKAGLTQIWRFWAVTPVQNQRWLWNDAQRLNYHKRGALLFYKVSDKFQGHTGRTKIADFFFGFTDCFEIMHKTWHNIEEMPHCFSKSFILFQSHMGRKSIIWI